MTRAPAGAQDQFIRDVLAAGVYSVTVDGEVFRHWKFKGAKPLKPKMDKTTGYYSVTLSWKNQQVLVRVHRLVALAHIPNPLDLPTVNHEDGVKTNNKKSNLTWVTYSEQQVHAYDTGLRSAKGEKNGSAKLTAPDVIELRRLREHDRWTLKSLGAKFDIHPMTAGEICRREIWKHV